MRVAALALSLLLAVTPALSDDRVWHHATALIGEPKYPEGFAHFDYVNPDAPKGGTLKLSIEGTFDTFNPILPKGSGAAGVGLIYQSLFTSSEDEISADYGELAEAVSYPADFTSATFRMNPRARWWDGEPVTAEDVVWSFNKLIELNASQANYYARVDKAEVTAPGEVTFTFKEAGNRELPSIMAQLTVLPQHWWEGKDAQGQQRDIGRSSLEPPMGSGPYRIASFSPAQTVVLQRVPDYWGATEGFGVGQNNFDEIRFEYFLDNTSEFEGFKAGVSDWWDENLSTRWESGYDFPAAKDGRIVRETFDNSNRTVGTMTGFIPNLRLPLFQNEALREAMLYAFDYEELDRIRFHGQYDRVSSYWFGTELASSGLPQGEELDILNSVKDLVPARVFDTPYANPIGGTTGKGRANLATATELLASAGYTLNGDQLVDPNGQPVTFEIMLPSDVLEPIVSRFTANLKKLGIKATMRVVDSTQYDERVRARNFQMIYGGWRQTLSPGNEQRDQWGSVSATQSNSRNYAGISDKGVDALIEKVVFADDRDTLVAATHALDRVLLAHHFVIPTYTLRRDRIARWDRFSHPDPLPEYSVGFPQVWWFDAAKSAAVDAKGK